MKIGLYGGTFNPFHLGHLSIVKDSIRELNLKFLYLVPNNRSPHKKISPVNGQIRYNMLKSVIDNQTKFHNRIRISDFEITRDGPSYSIDTVNHLLKLHPECTELFLIIGSDNLSQIKTWHKFNELNNKVTFVIFERTSNTQDNSLSHPLRRYTLIPISENADSISSTEIRKLIANNNPFEHLVPEEVSSFIKTNHLYT